MTACPSLQPAPEAKDLAADYKKKIDSSIEVINQETYRNLSVKGTFDEIKAVPISEVTIFVRAFALLSC